MKIYSSILMQRIETRVDNNEYQNRESYTFTLNKEYSNLEWSGADPGLV